MKFPSCARARFIPAEEEFQLNSALYHESIITHEKWNSSRVAFHCDGMQMTYKMKCYMRSNLTHNSGGIRLKDKSFCSEREKNLCAIDTRNAIDASMYRKWLWHVELTPARILWEIKCKNKLQSFFFTFWKFSWNKKIFDFKIKFLKCFSFNLFHSYFLIFS